MGNKCWWKRNIESQRMLPEEAWPTQVTETGSRRS